MISKKKIALLLMTSGMMALIGCSGKEDSVRVPINQDRQEETEVEEKTELEKEESDGKEETAYEKVPYQLYPISEDAWVGDVMPMSDGDVLQLYYLYDTDHNGPGYHPIYKFSTSNFYEYQDDGLVLPFGETAEEPDFAIGTGSILKAQDGCYHCFYTGHNDTFPEKGLDKECMMHAVSEDNVTWTKIPEDTFYAADYYSGDDFRDPFVFWNEEEQCYWMLVAAREESLGGVVARYTSQDLSEWVLCEPLYAPGKQYMLECPDLFKLGDKYYLFYSWDCVTYYAMGDSIYGPFAEPEDNVLDGAGFCFYAAKTAKLGGSRYLCGWIGRKPSEMDAGTYDWAGNMLIHELVQKEDGTLGVKEPSSLRDYYREEKSLKADKALRAEAEDDGYILSPEGEDFAFVDFGRRDPSVLLECTVSMKEGGCAGFAFGEGEEYGKYIGLALDEENDMIRFNGSALERITLAGAANITEFPFEADKEYHVKLIMENEIVVLYVDDTKAMSNRIYRSVDGVVHWGIFASGAEAVFHDVNIHVPVK